METNNPTHVGIVLDGNRRFAKRLMLEPWKGHEYGFQKVEKTLDHAREIGLKQATLYCLSVENIKKRPKEELEFLYKIFRGMFKDLDNKKVEKYKIRFRFLGRLDLLPKDLEEECKKLEKKTQNNHGFYVNFAIAYGGRQEIVDAIKKIIQKKIKPEEITEEIIKENLYLSDEPDIIIRTGGEKRTSNFLPFQSSYSEWFFLDKFWPEFENEDLDKIIEDFKKRKRNFGK
jgi:tritrans,polycis-undecaprenyl-diphosphate synthase [geranylgeranyl-diphosphate specific]